MKNLITGMLLMVIVSPAFAAQIKAKCTNASNTGFIEDKTMNIIVDKSKVEAESKNYKFAGDFIKIVNNGSYMYDGSDVAELADQTDFGYIFVSSKLVKGMNGSITFSTRQLGDSGGSNWLNETFNCKVVR